MTSLSVVLLILCILFFLGLLVTSRDAVLFEKKWKETVEAWQKALAEAADLKARLLDVQIANDQQKREIAQLSKKLEDAAYAAIGQAATFPDCPRCQSPMRKGKHCPRCGYPAGGEEARRVRQKPFSPLPDFGAIAPSWFDKGERICLDCGAHNAPDAAFCKDCHTPFSALTRLCHD